MSDFDESNNYSGNRLIKEKFHEDFHKGCLAFLTVAMVVTGECTSKNPHQKLNEMLGEIVGNRQHHAGVTGHIPQIFDKVIEYCNEARIISEQIEQETMKGI
jgi:hypothetical protein